jgi:multidrug resistance efflux pump
MPAKHATATTEARSPERQAIADAQAELAAAIATVTCLEIEVEGATDALYAARHAQEQAEAVAARAAGPRPILEYRLARSGHVYGDAPPPPPEVAEAVRQAVAAHDAAERHRADLRERLEAARAAKARAERSFDTAIVRAIQVSPELAKLLADIDRMRHELLSNQRAAEWLLQRNVVSRKEAQDLSMPIAWTAIPGAGPWEAAFEALRAHSGDGERPIQLIVNTGSGDHEHLLALA